MNIFKAGDQVYCVVNEGYIDRFHLDTKAIHIVVKVSDKYVQLKNHGSRLFTATRFILATPSTPYSMVCHKIQSMEKRFKERHAYS